MGKRHKGYYTVARRYGFYVRVARTISFLTREHKIHIFELPSYRVMLYLLIWTFTMTQYTMTIVVKNSYDTIHNDVNSEKQFSDQNGRR